MFVLIILNYRKNLSHTGSFYAYMHIIYTHIYIIASYLHKIMNWYELVVLEVVTHKFEKNMVSVFK